MQVKIGMRFHRHQHPSPNLLEVRQSSPPLCKKHKKPEVDKKIQACETLH